METIRGMLDKDEELRRVVRAAILSIILEGDGDILEVLDEPSENKAVADILQEVGRRIFATKDEQKIRNFRMLCEMIGIPVDWDESDVILELGPISGEFAAEERPPNTGQIPIARMTGRIPRIPPRRAREEMRDQPVLMGPSRMRYIKRGTIKMEICVDDGSYIHNEGDVVLLTSDNDSVRVKIKGVKRYKTIAELVAGEQERIGDWLSMSAKDAMPFVWDAYGDVKGEFVVYYFEKVNT